MVDRFGSTRRLLADLRRRGVDQLRLLVFRGPLPDGLAGALEQSVGVHERWGPPASVGARTPPGGTRFRVGGPT